VNWEVIAMPRVLVIDDEEVVQTMLRRLLEKNGYEVATARNGVEGIEAQRNAPAAIVVTDILMPEKEGFETIRELRKVTPTVKIIAISGGGRNDPSDYLQFATAFGADRSFPKPLDLPQFLAAIQDLLHDGPGQ
jgi:CheY-like chemotaxis protein